MSASSPSSDESPLLPDPHHHQKSSSSKEELKLNLESDLLDKMRKSEEYNVESDKLNSMKKSEELREESRILDEMKKSEEYHDESEKLNAMKKSEEIKQESSLLGKMQKSEEYMDESEKLRAVLQSEELRNESLLLNKMKLSEEYVDESELLKKLEKSEDNNNNNNKQTRVQGSLTQKVSESSSSSDDDGYQLTRAEKLSCVCARFKVNDTSLREVDLSNFDIFAEEDLSGSSRNKNNNNNNTAQVQSADSVMMTICSLLQEGARSNTLVTKISFRNSNLDDDFVIQFVQSLQDLAKTSRRKQFLKHLDLRDNEKITDDVVFPILEAVLFHSSLTLIDLEGTKVSEKNKTLINAFSRLQKYPAAVKQLAWDIWTSPMYISEKEKKQEKQQQDEDDDTNENHHIIKEDQEQEQEEPQEEEEDHSIICPTDRRDQIPNIQFAVLYRDNNDPRAYTSEAVNVIVSLLKEAPSTLRTLRFDPDCLRGDASAERLAEFFRHCHSSFHLRELNVRNNAWTSRGLSFVLDAIEEKFLQEQQVQRHQMQAKKKKQKNNTNTLLAMTRHNLTVLDIGNNDIDDRGIQHLSRIADTCVTNLVRVAIDGNSKVSPSCAHDLFRACSINVEGATLRPALELIETEYDTLVELNLRGEDESGRATHNSSCLSSSSSSSLPSFVAPMSNVGMKAIFTRMFETFELKKKDSFMTKQSTTTLRNDGEETLPKSNVDEDNNNETGNNNNNTDFPMPCLRSLIISNHNFSVEAVRRLANLIKMHKTLTFIDLSDNKAIDDECIHHIVRALYGNNSVTKVSISNCSVSSRLAAQLEEACQLNREPHPLKYYVQLRGCDPTLTKLSLRKQQNQQQQNYQRFRGSDNNNKTEKKPQIDAESFKWINQVLERQPQVVEVDFSGCENIGDDPATFGKLIELIRLSLPFSRLNISFTRLHNELARKISSALYLNHNLNQIIATGNARLHGECAELLHTSTTMNQLPPQFKSLYRYLSNGVQGITRICFDENASSSAATGVTSNGGIGNEGARILLSCLSKAPHVTHLTLSYQQLTDSCAQDLEHFLSTQSNLKEICLSHNSLGDNAALALAEVIGQHRETTCLSSNANNNDNNNNTQPQQQQNDVALLENNKSNNNNNTTSSSSTGGLVMLDLSYNLIGDYGISELIRGVQHHLFAPLPYSLRRIDVTNNLSASDLPSAISALDLRLEWCLQPMEFQAMFARTLPILLRSVMNHKKDMEKESRRIEKQNEKERKQKERVEEKAASRAKKALDRQMKTIFKKNSMKLKEEEKLVSEMLKDVKDDDDNDDVESNAPSEESSTMSSGVVAIAGQNNTGGISISRSETPATATSATGDETASDEDNDDDDTSSKNSDSTGLTGGNDSSTFLPFDTVMNLSFGAIDMKSKKRSSKRHNNNNNDISPTNNNNHYRSSSKNGRSNQKDDNDDQMSIGSSSKLSFTNASSNANGTNNSQTQVIKKYSGYIWNEKEITFVGSDAIQLNSDSFRVLLGLMMEQKIHFKNQPSRVQAVRFPRHRFSVSQLEGIGKIIEALSKCRVLDLNGCNFLDRKVEEEWELKRQLRLQEDSENERKLKEKLQLEQQRRMNATAGELSYAEKEQRDEDERKARRKLEVLHDIVASSSPTSSHQNSQHGGGQHQHSNNSLSSSSENNNNKHQLAMFHESMNQRNRRLAVKEEKLSQQIAQAQEKRILQEEKYRKEQREVITKESIQTLIDISIRCSQLQRVYLCSSANAMKLLPVGVSSSNSNANNNSNNNNSANTDSDESIVTKYFDYFYDVIVDELFWRQHIRRHRKRQELPFGSFSKIQYDADNGAITEEDENDDDLYFSYYAEIEREKQRREDEEEEEEDYSDDEDDSNDDGGSLSDDSNEDVLSVQNNDDIVFDVDNESRRKRRRQKRRAERSRQRIINKNTLGKSTSGDDISSSVSRATTPTSRASSPTASSLNSTSHSQHQHHNKSSHHQQHRRQDSSSFSRKNSSNNNLLSQQHQKGKYKSFAIASDFLNFLRVPNTEDPELKMLELRLLSVLKANTFLPTSARQVWIRAALSHWQNEDRLYETAKLKSSVSTGIAGGGHDEDGTGSQLSMMTLSSKQSPTNSTTRKRSPPHQQQQQTARSAISHDSPSDHWKTLTVGSLLQQQHHHHHHPSSTNNNYTNNNTNSILAIHNFEVFNDPFALSFLLNSISPIPLAVREIDHLITEKVNHDEKIKRMKEEKETEEAAERQRQRDIEERQKRRRSEGIFLDLDQQFGGDNDDNEEESNNNNHDTTPLKNKMNNNSSSRTGVLPVASSLRGKPPGSLSSSGLQTGASVRFLNAINDERERAIFAEQDKSLLRDFSNCLVERYHTFCENVNRHHKDLEAELVQELHQAKSDLEDLDKRERRNLYGDISEVGSAARRRMSAALLPTSPLQSSLSEGNNSDFQNHQSVSQIGLEQQQLQLHSKSPSSHSTSVRTRSKPNQVVQFVGGEHDDRDIIENNNNEDEDDDEEENDDENHRHKTAAQKRQQQKISDIAATHEKLLDEITQQRDIQERRDVIKDRIRFLKNQLKICRMSSAVTKNRTKALRKLHSVDFSKLKPLPDICVVLLTFWLRCVAPQTIHAISLPFIQSATSREAVAILLESEEGQTIRRFHMGQDPDVAAGHVMQMNSAVLSSKTSGGSKTTNKIESLEEFALLKKINQLCDRNRKGLFHFPTAGSSSSGGGAGQQQQGSMFSNRFKSIRNYVLVADEPVLTNNHGEPSASASTPQPSSTRRSLFENKDNNNNNAAASTPPPFLTATNNSSSNNNNNTNSNNPFIQSFTYHEDPAANKQTRLEQFQRRRQHLIARLRTETADIDKDADQEVEDWSSAVKLGGAFGLDDTKTRKLLTTRNQQKGKKRVSILYQDDHDDEKTSEVDDEHDESSSFRFSMMSDKEFVTRGRKYLAAAANLSPRSMRKMLEEETRELEKISKKETDECNENNDEIEEL